MKTLRFYQKIFISLFLSLVIFASYSISVSAQSATSCFQTAVGTPPAGDAPTLPPECNTGGGGIGACEVAPNINTTTTKDYTKEIESKFGINVSNLPEPMMKSIWEEFHAIGCSTFLSDIKGAVVEGWTAPDGPDKGTESDAYSYQESCPNDPGVDVFFHNGYNDTTTKGLIVHELTHVWQKCNPNGVTQLSEIPTIISSDGNRLTYYSQTGCGFTGINLDNEDHAETIAFHLNPQLGEITCGNDRPNPYTNGAFPAHKAFAIQGVGEFPPK